MSIVEVAKRAKVSIATVSRVLNNSRAVNHDVAHRVREAAKELRYTPLRKRRGATHANIADTGLKNIALVSIGHAAREWLGMPVMAAVVAELTRTANAHGLSVMIEELAIAEPRRTNSRINQRGIDGALVFISSSANPEQVNALAKQIPIVQVLGSPLTATSIDYVGPDNGRIGYIAAEYLLSRGCKSLGVLTTSAQWDFTLLRAEGFAWAVRLTGSLPTVFLTSADNHALECYGPRLRTKPTLAELVDEVIAVRPDGLFISRDQETADVYRLLEARGVRPNRDIAIVSCDNEQVRLAALAEKPVSVDLNAGEIARRAVNRLINRARNRNEPTVRILIEPEILV